MFPQRNLHSNYNIHITPSFVRFSSNEKYTKTMNLPTTSLPIRPDPWTTDQIIEQANKIYQLQVRKSTHFL